MMMMMTSTVKMRYTVNEADDFVRSNPVRVMAQVDSRNYQTNVRAMVQVECQSYVVNTVVQMKKLDLLTSL